MRILRYLAVFALLAGGVQAEPGAWERAWPGTDFSITTIEDWGEIISGGPGRDGIPALSDPQMQRVAQKEGLEPQEAVITLEPESGPARAYPLRYLIWHEIVNDEVEGRPVAVTYCPLCNSAITFDATVQGRELEFGVTGKLRHSDMVMYDRQSESWWQQATGVGIVGEMTGVRLETLPSWMESWQSFSERNPEGLVMAEPSHRRPYGRNPYVGYDTSARPFLYSGENPPHGIDPLVRVVRVGDRAWPMPRLAEAGVMREAGVEISWQEGKASALDDRAVAAGRDVGQVRVRDAEGRDLPHDVMFAFAFHAFWPEGTWMLGD